MTTGCKLISQAAAPLFHKILCTLIISWSGFSIHSQVLSFIGKTGVSAILYFVAKFFHAVLVTAIAWLVIKFNQTPVCQCSTGSNIVRASLDVYTVELMAAGLFTASWY